MPADDLLPDCHRLGWDVAVVSVTSRELHDTSWEVSLSALHEVPETFVWDESRWGRAVWGSAQGASRLQAVLDVISGGTFPRDRSNLTSGNRRQLRDAMILEAHLRARRDIFVTEDRRAFVHRGRREQLQSSFGTRIMTKSEFSAYCSSISAPPE
jgi:hypothetical protein